MFYKVNFVGFEGAGKSSIIQRLLGGQFSHEYTPTKQAQHRPKTTIIGGEEVGLFFRDSAQQPLSPSGFKCSSLCCLVFNIHQEISIQKIQQQIDKIQQFTKRKTKIILVGNKADLGRSCSRKDILSYVGKWNTSYIEVSALTGQNINQLEAKIISSIEE